jgi:hypothetical protein
MKPLLAVAQAVIEGAATETSNEEVQFTVVVVIGDGDAHAPAAPRQASFRGDVLEGAVGLLMIESNERVPAGTDALDGGTVDEDNVEPPIVVAVEEAGTATGGVDNIMSFWSGDMCCGDADFFGDVFKDRDGW